MPSGNTSAFEFETIVASDVSTRLTEKKYVGAEKAFITCEGSIRYRYDDGEPTTVEGHLLSDGFLVLEGTLNIQRFKFINSGELHSVVSVSYER